MIEKTQPSEIYNLAAQSHVHVSFEEPEYTANTAGLGALRILEAIRILNLENETKFYQASTSEMYGDTIETPSQKKLFSNRHLLMRPLNFMRTGSPQTIAAPMEYSLQMEFCLIMNHL